MKPQKDTNAFQANTKRFFLFLFLLLGIYPQAVCADTVLKDQEGVLPDGRGYTGNFVVGEPMEIYKLHKIATDSYDRQDYSNAVSVAEEAVMRYERSEEVAGGKVGFNRFSATNEMARLYGIMAEKEFSQAEIDLKKTGLYLLSANRFSRDITNDILWSAYGVKQYCHATYSFLTLDYASTTNNRQDVYFRLLAEKGWSFFFEGDDAAFYALMKPIAKEKGLSTARLLPGKEGRYIRRWYGLGVYREDSLEESLAVQEMIAKKWMVFCEIKTNYVYFLEAQEAKNQERRLSFAQRIIELYNTLEDEKYTYPDELLSYVAASYFVIADACFGAKKHQEALHFLDLAEGKGYPVFKIDSVRTEVLLCAKRNEAALLLFNKYWLPLQEGRETYFQTLIKDGYLFLDLRDLENISLAFQVLKKTFSLTNEIVCPHVIHLSNAGSPIGNGTILWQYVGYGNVRHVSTEGQILSGMTKVERDYKVRTGSFFAPDGDFIVVREETNQVVYQAKIINGTSYWRNVKGRVSCLRNISVDNVLWYSNPSNRLGCITSDNIIIFREMKRIPSELKPFQSLIKGDTKASIGVSNNVVLGKSKFAIDDFTLRTGLIPSPAPFIITASNTVVFTDDAGIPQIAQIRQVDTLFGGKKAQWIDPCSGQPSPIKISNIYRVTINVKEDDISQLVMTTRMGVVDKAIREISDLTGISIEILRKVSTFRIILALILLAYFIGKVQVVSGIVFDWAARKLYSGFVMGSRWLWRCCWSRYLCYFWGAIIGEVVLWLLFLLVFRFVFL